MDEYARFAHLYDSLVGPFLRPVYRAVLATLPKPGGQLLDLCCGTGLLTGMAAKAGQQTVGVDISPAMLEQARTAHPDVSFVHGDATALPFQSGRFDTVTLCFALHEKPAPIGYAILAEARRILRPDGLILVADYRLPRTGFGQVAGWPVALVERLAGKEHFARYREFMRTGGSRAFLEKGGLKTSATATFLCGRAGLYKARP